MTLHKSFQILEMKTDAVVDGVDPSGEFQALVSVFNNVDRVGDRIKPGAFTKTLARWEASGDPIPVILSHQWNDAFAHIGVVNPKDAKQTDRGLMVKGKLDIADNPVARQVYKLMQRRSLKEFSFGYSVPKGGQKKAKDGANDLLEVDLAEIGPTLKGANPDTELHAVKAALGLEDRFAGMSAAELKKAASDAERDENERRVGEAPDPVETPAKDESPERTVPNEVPDTAEQRQRAEEAAREQQRADDEARAGSTPPEAPPEPETPPPPKAAEPRLTPEQLRAEADAAERERRKADEAARVGEVPPAPALPPVEVKRETPPPEPELTPAELRAKADAIERDRREADEKERLGPRPADPPEVKAPVIPNIDTLQRLATEASAEASRPVPDLSRLMDIVNQLGDLLRTAFGVREVPAVAPLRRRAAEEERKAEEARIPDIPDAPVEVHPILDAIGELPAKLPLGEFAKRIDRFRFKGEHLYVRAIHADEAEGVSAGELKAVWSGAYVNNLPDSAFLYVEPAGEKDSEGKTVPRSLRHFPYRDADGNIDLPHLRNALARIPQSSLSQEIKDRLTASAQRILDRQSGKTDGTDRKTVDPLRQQADEVALEFASGGESLRRRPPQKKANGVQPRGPELPLDDLKRRMYEETLTAISGTKE